MLPGKEASRPSEARGYLVEDEQQAVFAAQAGGFAQVLRMIEPHTARALYDGFEDEGGQFVGMTFDGLFQRQDVVGVPFAVETRAGLRHEVAHGQGASEERVHARDGVADRHGIPRVAVVARADGDEIVFLLLSPSDPILYGHLQRYLHGYGA